MPGSIISLAYDTSTGRFLSQIGGYGPTLIANLAIVSGKLADNSVHLAAIAAGLFTAGATARAKFADGFLVSAKVGAGELGDGHIADLAATKLTGLLPHTRISGLPYANLYLTNSLVNADIVDLAATKLTGLLNAARISGLPYANLDLTNSLLTADMVDNAIVSGKLGSGAIPDKSVSEAQLVSGISIDISEYSVEPGYTAKEAISSEFCVYMDTDKKIGIGLATSATMPAIGIARELIASGDAGLIQYGGRLDIPGATDRISGQYGQALFVGSGGYLVVSPPAMSGDVVQRVGVVAGNDSMFIIPSPIVVHVAG